MPSQSIPPRESKRGPLLIIALGLLLIGVVVAIVKLIQGAPTAAGENAGRNGGDGQGPPPAAVFVAPVRLEPARDESVVTGTLRAVSRAEIAAQEAEAVAEVLADEGDRVAKGDRLVRLDGRRLDAQVAEARARLASAKKLVSQQEAELERAKTDLSMKTGLLEDKAISRSEFLDAERALAVEQAQQEASVQSVAEEESRLDLLEIRRGDLEILAPFDGVIAERHVEPGEWVGAGQAVMTLVTVDPLEAWMSVPERHLGDVAGRPEGIHVRLSSSGEVFTPTKVAVVPDVEPRSQLFTVVATLANPNAKLAAGQSITGIVPVGKEEPHFIFPVDALIRARLGDFVFVAGAAGEDSLPIARKVPVTVHFERDEFAFVRANGAALKESDRVVVEGNDRLAPGQPLMGREKGETQPGPAGPATQL